MGATPQRRYGAANAYTLSFTEYAPDPARPIRHLMADIAARLTGRRGGTYPPGPGVPETSFTGYSPKAPTSVTRSIAGAGMGGGRAYPDEALNTMASGLSDSDHADVVNALFADRLRRRGVAM